jgi:proteic killer suppression protein
MEIKSVAHKGLRRLVEDGVRAGVPSQYSAKLEAIVSFLLAAPGIEAVQRLRSWGAHPLTGDRKGAWSLTVSRNWRVTFTVNADNEIEDLDFVDYH